MLICTLTLVLYVSTVLSLDNVPASYDPPGGLKPDNVPLFVVMGFDDCMYPDGMQWVMDTLLNNKNPAGNNNPKTFDGTPLNASFYLTTVYGDNTQTVDTWKKAYAKGYEISNHTNSHDDKILTESTSQSVWVSEMKTCSDWIVKNLGISESEIWGFRTPFLVYSKNSVAAVNEMKLIYDCSVKHGIKDFDHIFVWPYTLDKGAGAGAQGSVGTFPGLWEIPVYEALMGEGGYPTCCGMDYTIWSLQKTQQEAYNYLKWSLDIRLQSGKNRTPLTIGMHPDLYSVTNDEPLVLSWPAKVSQRKKAISDFVAYALAKPMVRFVCARQLIQWMRQPIGLDGSSGTVLDKSPSTAYSPLSIVRIAGNRFRISTVKDGIFRITLFTTQGRILSRIPHAASKHGSYEFSVDNQLAAQGIVVVKIENKDSDLQKMTSLLWIGH
jgi:peptidoglycan/xylan/chitin deacetylase (PgdA/CDA1 family)